MSDSALLAIVHDPQGGPGHFEAVIKEHGFDMEVASFSMGRPPSRQMHDYAALIILGGDAQVDQEDTQPWLIPEKQAITSAIAASVPTLGVCLGGQLIADVFGAQVGPVEDKLTGWNEVMLTPQARRDPLFANLDRQFMSFVWHLYEFAIPEDAHPLAMSAYSWQAFKLNDRPVWGMQFHPEVDFMTAKWWTDLQYDSGAVDDAARQAIYLDCERYAPAQYELTRTLCSAFLDEVAHDRRPKGFGDPSDQ